MKGKKLTIAVGTSVIILFVAISFNISRYSKELSTVKNQLNDTKQKFDELQSEKTKSEEKYKELEELYNDKIQVVETLQNKLDSTQEDNNKKDKVVVSNDQMSSKSNNENTSVANNKSNISPTIVSEKDKMIAEARKYFSDRGIKLNNSGGYSEMVGTNLISGITELEGHRVFAFTIDNYDIKDNNVWFYYSPETKVGYKYQNKTWTKI